MPRLKSPPPLLVATFEVSVEFERVSVPSLRIAPPSFEILPEKVESVMESTLLPENWHIAPPLFPVLFAEKPDNEMVRVPSLKIAPP